MDELDCASLSTPRYRLLFGRFHIEGSDIVSNAGSHLIEPVVGCLLIAFHDDLGKVEADFADEVVIIPFEFRRYADYRVIAIGRNFRLAAYWRAGEPLHLLTL